MCSVKKVFLEISCEFCEISNTFLRRTPLVAVSELFYEVKLLKKLKKFNGNDLWLNRDLKKITICLRSTNLVNLFSSDLILEQ